jgi:Saxitoxin biosynthesis operon protein SxtJ
MPLIRINRNPTGRQLAIFGLAWLVFCGILGLKLRMHGHGSAADATWILAAGVPLAGAFIPGLLQRIYLGFSYATYPLGLVVSFVFLAVVYYLVLTPIGLALRIFRYDPLCRRFDLKARSYWKSRDPKKSAESYFRQS